MKNKDIVAGMRVVPFKKSGGWLTDSRAWKRARENGQGYLYVIRYEHDNIYSSGGCWILSENFRSVAQGGRIGRSSNGWECEYGDYFYAGDFRSIDSVGEGFLEKFYADVLGKAGSNA